MSGTRSLFGSFRAARAARKKKASPAVVAAAAPWVRDGIDYGPARAALNDLAKWALDLADRATEGWPEGLEHVRKTRRYVEAQLAGARVRGVSTDDVMFTARLLARILDEDLGLGFSEAFAILDLLELPLDAIAIPRSMPRAVASQVANTVAQFCELVRDVAAREAANLAPTPPPLRFCDACGYIHEPGEHVHYREAA